MAEIIPSNTYKILFNDIIAEFLSQIFKKFPQYCLRSRSIPYELERKYEEYKSKAAKYMTHSKLDRHKLASCICGAIIEIQPISCLSNTKVPVGVNEILALYVALGIIKYFMMFDVLTGIPTYAARQRCKIYLKNNFELKLPSIDENICDTQEYSQNLTNALLWTHNYCEQINDTCFHYDIWAYSKIFYHIESQNKPILKAVCNEFSFTEIGQD